MMKTHANPSFPRRVKQGFRDASIAPAEPECHAGHSAAAKRESSVVRRKVTGYPLRGDDEFNKIKEPLIKWLIGVVRQAFARCIGLWRSAAVRMRTETLPHVPRTNSIS